MITKRLSMIRWHKKKIVIIASLLIVLYLLRCKKYDIEYEAIIQNALPMQVWEFMSDFNNVKKLNPTIEDFTIESESGHYHHWKYRVHYTEHLSQLPWVTNNAWADFEAKKLSEDKYAIYSNHKTCFWTTFTCVLSESTFLVEAMTMPDRFLSRYTESITYECPPLFSSFCRSEAMHQREIIRKNLQSVFSKHRLSRRTRS